jgi:hypothetical protein
MSRKIQLMVLPDASGNTKEPRKCHNHTLAYLSILASSAYGCKLLKRSHIHNDVTLEVFLKFIELHESMDLERAATIKNGTISYFYFLATSSSGGK